MLHGSMMLVNGCYLLNCWLFYGFVDDFSFCYAIVSSILGNLFVIAYRNHFVFVVLRDGISADKCL